VSICIRRTNSGKALNPASSYSSRLVGRPPGTATAEGRLLHRPLRGTPEKSKLGLLKGQFRHLGLFIGFADGVSLSTTQRSHAIGAMAYSAIFFPSIMLERLAERLLPSVGILLFVLGL
jgi:hypothetical protein